LIMRGGKDLANKEIRFQSLCQSVQQGPALHCRARWRCRPAAVRAGLRSAVMGRLVRLRIGPFMDGRRSRACRSAGQAHHPLEVR
jgi:hypothetical protein